MNGYVIQTGNGAFYGPFRSVATAAAWVRQPHDCKGTWVNATNNAPCQCRLLVLNEPDEIEEEIVQEVEAEAFMSALP